MLWQYLQEQRYLQQAQGCLRCQLVADQEAAQLYHSLPQLSLLLVEVLAAAAPS